MIVRFDSNLKNISPELSQLLYDIYGRYQKYIEPCQDIALLRIRVTQNVKDWSKENALQHSFYKKQNISHNSDVKWSTFTGVVDSLVQNRAKYLQKDHIVICIYGSSEIVETNIEAEHTRTTKAKSTKSESDVPPLNVFPVEPRHTLSRVIVADETMSEIKKCVALIKQKNLIYDEWGFSTVDPIRRSVINLYGPPGTGKTMVANAIANELGLQILALNYSDIESKYVGDAPKNLVSAFKRAKETGAVLFFDEADSFLGKRITNVSSSSDQAINSLRSQMLMLLESNDVDTIFATNLKENYDKAFESRILMSIGFSLPDKNARVKIIRSFIPEKAPIEKETLTEEFFNTLADLSENLSPRELKNLVLQTIISVVTQNRNKITTNDFIETFTKAQEKRDAEKRKQEEKKNALNKTIKTNMETNNFTVSKTEKYEGDKNE